MRRALLVLVVVAGCQRGRSAAVEVAPDAGLPVVSGRVLGDPIPLESILPPVPLPRETGARLLEPGAAPREVRRYAAPARATEQVLTLRAAIAADGVALPAIEHRIGVAAQGARLLLRPMAVTIAPGGDRDRARAHAQAWDALAGRRVTATVDPRGRIGAVRFDDVAGDVGAPALEPDPARDELWQWLLGLAVPLPDEPIGVGARWRVVTSLRVGPLRVEQTGVYRLDAIDGDRWRVTVEVRRIGQPQPVDGGRLVAYRREVRGEVTLGPDSPLPVAGSLALSLQVHARIDGGDVLAEDAGTIAIAREP